MKNNYPDFRLLFIYSSISERFQNLTTGSLIGLGKTPYLTFTSIVGDFWLTNFSTSSMLKYSSFSNIIFISLLSYKFEYQILLIVSKKYEKKHICVLTSNNTYALI